MITRGLLLVSCLLLAPFSIKGLESQPSIEVLIPKGMPIRIEAQLDQSQPNITKYFFKRIVTKDAYQASIIAVMVDKNGKIKLIDPMVNDNLIDPMSIAIADKSIARILLIVEWLETKKGKWVVDSEDAKLDIESIVKNGAKALPCAKLLENEPRAKGNL